VAVNLPEDDGEVVCIAAGMLNILFKRIGNDSLVWRIGYKSEEEVEVYGF